MTVVLKEVDGARGVSIELRAGVLYIDGGDGASCFAFDVALFLRAIERAVGVVFARRLKLPEPSTSRDELPEEDRVAV